MRADILIIRKWSDVLQRDSLIGYRPSQLVYLPVATHSLIFLILRMPGGVQLSRDCRLQAQLEYGGARPAAARHRVHDRAAVRVHAVDSREGDRHEAEVEREVRPPLPLRRLPVDRGRSHFPQGQLPGNFRVRR